MRSRAVKVFADRFVLNGAVVRRDAVTRVREHDKGFDDFVAMAGRRMNFPLAWWSGLERGDALLFERYPEG